MSTDSHYAGQLAVLSAKYRSKGRDEALQLRPPSTASELDGNESALLTEANGFLAQEFGLLDQERIKASRTLDSVEAQNAQVDATIDHLAADNTISGQLHAQIESERTQIRERIKNRVLLEVQFRHFRHKNEITEEPEEKGSLVFGLGIIFLFMIIETVANAFFYENSQGLLGGFIVALLVSALNIAVALVLGIMWRYKNLKDQDKKILGWSSLALFILLTLYCNALFSTFLSEYQILEDPTDPMQLRDAFLKASASAKDIFTLQLQIPDLASFLLFGFSTILAFFAFWKAYTLDDKYPGYGSIFRRMVEKRELEKETRAIIAAQAKSLLDSKKMELQKATNATTDMLNALSSCKAGLAGAYAVFKVKAESIQRDFEIVLNSYRTSNKAVRGAPAPEYFNTTPALFGTEYQDEYNRLIESINRLFDKISESRQTRTDQLNRKIMEVQSLSASFQREVLPKFFNEVEEEVKDDLDSASSDYSASKASR